MPRTDSLRRAHLFFTHRVVVKRGDPQMLIAQRAPSWSQSKVRFDALQWNRSARTFIAAVGSSASASNARTLYYATLTFSGSLKGNSYEYSVCADSLRNICLRRQCYIDRRRHKASSQVRRRRTTLSKHE